MFVDIYMYIYIEKLYIYKYAYIYICWLESRSFEKLLECSRTFHWPLFETNGFGKATSAEKRHTGPLGTKRTLRLKRTCILAGYRRQRDMKGKNLLFLLHCLTSNLSKPLSIIYV